MLKKYKKLVYDVKGFTLTEVMIGIMILTVAIVSATNLLISLMTTNQNNLTTLQAYYLAQEGLEAMRNIRDTNWLHNRGWLSKDSVSLWGKEFEIPVVGEVNFYAVDLKYNGFNVPQEKGSTNNIGDLLSVRPWSVDESDGKIFKNTDGDNVYLGPAKDSTAVDTGFKRTILIKPYDINFQNKYVLVQSKVEWNIGARQRELTLSEVLTDWKGGAL